MDVTRYIPTQALPALRWLWKKQGWFKPRVTFRGCEYLDLLLPDPDNQVDKASYRFLWGWVNGCKKAVMLGQQGPGELATIYSCARMAGEGPKVFLPTDEQCEAMLNVEIDLPKEYFRTPYPNFCVHFPKEFVKRHAELSVRKRFPNFAMITQAPDPRLLFVRSDYVDKWDGMVNIMTTHTGGTIEEGLTTRFLITGPEEEYTDNEKCQRLAMNFALMLTNVDCQLRYKNTQQAEAIDRKLGKQLNPDKRRELYETRLGLVQEIVPDQRTKFYDEVKEKGEALGLGHASPRTHWRRGFWRRQAGYREIEAAGGKAKLTFIRPVLVNAGLGQAPQAVEYRPK